MIQAAEPARRRHLQAVGGRVPPHNLEAEESLLGAMLLSRDAIAAAVERVSPEDFYKPSHAHVFRAVLSLYGRGEPADPVTVVEELRRTGTLESVGDPSLLLSLQVNTPSTGNAAHYARIVEEHALLRRLVAVAGEIAELGYSLPESVEEALDRAESMVFEIAERRQSDTMSPLRELLAAGLDRLEELCEREETVTGVPTGFRDLDARLAGLQPSNLVVVGARPSMGKTSFALSVVSHAAIRAKVPVLLFSLEMSHLELTQRLLSSEASVDSARLRNGKGLTESDWTKISHAIGKLGDAPIYIDDNPRVTVMDILAKSRRLKSKVGLGLVVVDYLQLMTGRSGAENRQVEVSEISRGLKILARELAVPVLALSQLSRNLEMRSDKRPLLADLRESGCLTGDTRLARADTGAEVTMAELLESGEEGVELWAAEDGRMVPATMTAVFSSGVKPVFDLCLGSGRRVRATANHRFLTSKGWRRLDELAVGDLLAMPGRLPEPARVCPQSVEEIVDLARRVGRHRRALRSMPDSVFALPNEQVALFLRHLWGVSGRVSSDARRSRVNCRLAVKRSLVADEVQSLLLRLGIASRTQSASSSSGDVLHYVSITEPEDQLRFLYEVGIYGREGRQTAEAIEMLVRSLPAVSSRGEAVGDPATGAVEVRIEERLRQLDGTGSDDTRWDRVAAIRPMGEEPVFDATVPGPHNFVANGVVAHNSIEQDADVVIFIYRDDVYNPESEQRGTAEILISKHRNGPTGVVDLAFIEHYTRFADMARV
jgi:replicative DNA helicase